MFYINQILGDKITNDKKIKDTTIKNTQSGEQKKSSGPHIVTNHPSGNLVISIGSKVDNKSSTSKKQYHENSESEVKQTAKYQKTKNAMNIVKTEDDLRYNNGIKLTEETNLYRLENKSTITQPSQYILMHYTHKYKIYWFSILINFFKNKYIINNHICIIVYIILILIIKWVIWHIY